MYVNLPGLGQGLLLVVSCNWTCCNFEPSCYFTSMMIEKFGGYFESSFCSWISLKLQLSGEVSD